MPTAKEDTNFDQYRFPLASLFLELYCPRTTDIPFNDPNVFNADLPQNVLLPGTPGRVSSLYTVDGSNKVALDLGKRAPANGNWGRQPVWRIAISEYDTVSQVADRHPNNLVLDLNKTANLTHQTTTAANIAGVAWLPPAAPDQVTGSGLRYDLSDPADPSTLPFTPILPVAFDRFVWFTDVGPTDVSPGVAQDIPDLKTTLAPFQRQAVYYSRSGSPTLQGGSYLVVGPRALTEFGSSTNSRSAPYNQWKQPLKRTEIEMSPADKPILSRSSQRISLAGTNVNNYMMNNVEANFEWKTMIKIPVPLICAADPPRDSPSLINPTWSAAFPNGVGLNISFPNPYLTTAANPTPANPMWAAAKAPTLRLHSTDAGGFADIPPDSWIDVTGTAVVGNLPNDPYDDRPSSGTALNTEIAKLGNDKPLGTYENVRAAYLQRLADPEFGYDPINNPYITVDWISLDLTVFNGEAPVHPDPEFNAPKPTKLQSRYKDGKFTTGPNTSEDGSTSGFSYHSPSTKSFENSVTQTAPPLVQHKSYFEHQLGYRTPINWSDIGSSGTTLGYVNVGFTSSGIPLTSVQMADANCKMGQYTNQFDGFGPPVTNFSLNPPDTVSPAVWGAPRNITSLAWFNRPFASPHELMLVPFTGPGQFGYYHSGYTGTQRKAFGFLPSFHATNPANTEEPPPLPLNPTRSFWLTETTPPAVDESDFQYLLELVETPAPFADAHKVIRPDAINALITSAGSSPFDYVALRFLNSYVRPNYYVTPPTNSFDMFRGPGLASPSNLIPTYVAAGKVNLNTVSELISGDVPALKAIENNFLTQSERAVQADPIQGPFMAARRGYDLPGAGNNLFFTDPPGFSNFGGIANPLMHSHYPTQFAGAFRPASTANIAPFVPNPEARARMRGRFGVETTLARSLDPLAYTAATPPPPPPPTPPFTNDINSRAPMFADTSTTNLATQNAFIRNQRAMRLPNLITNQSNVFAVWVTVSLYEYDPITGFGNEYLDDLGEPKRERSFYIIDRSLPVGFKPGENLNTDRTILLHRKLD